MHVKVKADSDKHGYGMYRLESSTTNMNILSHEMMTTTIEVHKNLCFFDDECALVDQREKQLEKAYETNRSYRRA